MKKNLLKILNAPWYFLPFAAYPVLALLSYNISQVRYTAGIRPLIISVAAAVLLFLLFRLIYKDWHRAAFATAVFTVLFLYLWPGFRSNSEEMEVPICPSGWEGSGWSCLSWCWSWAGWHRAHFQGAALTLNIISLGLVVYAVSQVVLAVPDGKQSDKPADPHAPVQTLQYIQRPNPAGYLLYHS